MFKPERDFPRPYQYDDNVHLSFSYEMDLNSYTIQRQVYTSFDFLSDVGGLRDILLLLGGLIFAKVQGNWFMISAFGPIFKVENSKGRGTQHAEASNPINE